eukprot:9132182-Pyramimonas_sp.AAC.1
MGRYRPPCLHQLRQEGGHRESARHESRNCRTSTSALDTWDGFGSFGNSCPWSIETAGACRRRARTSAL